MAGEMIKLQGAEKGEEYWKGKSGIWGSILGDGTYCIRPNYPTHFKLADALRRRGYKNATVEAFDTYQGPYIAVNGDIKIGNPPYQYCPSGLGVIRLWLTEDRDQLPCLYREDTNKSYPIFDYDNVREIIRAALSLLSKKKEEVKK